MATGDQSDSRVEGTLSAGERPRCCERDTGGSHYHCGGGCGAVTSMFGHYLHISGPMPDWMLGSGLPVGFEGHWCVAIRRLCEVMHQGTVTTVEPPVPDLDGILGRARQDVGGGTVEEAIRGLHHRVYDGYIHQDVCSHCSGDRSWTVWPCPTIQALDDALGVSSDPETVPV